MKNIYNIYKVSVKSAEFDNLANGEDFAPPFIGISMRSRPLFLALIGANILKDQIFLKKISLSNFDDFGCRCPSDTVAERSRG